VAIPPVVTEPPDPKVNLTMLDAQGQGRVLYMSAISAQTIEGLRLTGGNTSGFGGGVYIVGATATITTIRCLATRLTEVVECMWIIPLLRYKITAYLVIRLLGVGYIFTK